MECGCVMVMVQSQVCSGPMTIVKLMVQELAYTTRNHVIPSHTVIHRSL